MQPAARAYSAHMSNYTHTGLCRCTPFSRSNCPRDQEGRLRANHIADARQPHIDALFSTILYRSGPTTPEYQDTHRGAPDSRRTTQVTAGCPKSGLLAAKKECHVASFSQVAQRPHQDSTTELCAQERALNGPAQIGTAPIASSWQLKSATHLSLRPTLRCGKELTKTSSPVARAMRPWVLQASHLSHANSKCKSRPPFFSWMVTLQAKVQVPSIARCFGSVLIAQSKFA